MRWSHVGRKNDYELRGRLENDLTKGYLDPHPVKKKEAERRETRSNASLGAGLVPEGPGLRVREWSEMYEACFSRKRVWFQKKEKAKPREGLVVEKSYRIYDDESHRNNAERCVEKSKIGMIPEEIKIIPRESSKLKTYWSWDDLMFWVNLYQSSERKRTRSGND